MNPPYKAIEFIIENSCKFAEAKAQRIYLEEFRKSKKAMLMKDSLKSGVEAANAQEREAYADPEMVDLLKGLQAAVEIEEKLKWDITAAELRVEIWRTEQANNRAEGKATL